MALRSAASASGVLAASASDETWSDVEASDESPWLPSPRLASWLAPSPPSTAEMNRTSGRQAGAAAPSVATSAATTGRARGRGLPHELIQKLPLRLAPPPPGPSQGARCALDAEEAAGALDPPVASSTNPVAATTPPALASTIAIVCLFCASW